MNVEGCIYELEITKEANCSLYLAGDDLKIYNYFPKEDGKLEL